MTSTAKPKVAIVGYGSQGRAHALNLRDSGFDVTIGLRPGGPTEIKAKADGFAVRTPAEAVKDAQIVAVLTPDMVQPQLYGEVIEPNIAQGACLLFAHGFNVHYGQITPREDLDVVLVAPKGPGALVRREYEIGRGVPSVYAVHQDRSGNAEQLALRRDDDAVNGNLRALRCRVVLAERFDHVADELEPERLRLPRRVQIEDPAADAELAGLVDGIFGVEAGHREQLAEMGRRDLGARRERQARGAEARRWREAGGKRAGRGDDKAGRSRCHRVQCRCTDRSYLQVRREAAVRVDLVAGQRDDGVTDSRLPQSLDRIEEIARVRRELLDLGVGGHDDDQQDDVADPPEHQAPPRLGNCVGS